MKILWHSNAPWAPTGYGVQTGLFTPYVAKDYDLAISTFYGLDGACVNWNGIRVMPGLAGTFGNDYLLAHAGSHFGGSPRGGLMFSLLDSWVLDPDIVGQTNALCWTPIDHEPPPPLVYRFFNCSDAIPLAMSRFGEEQLADLDPLYCPHGVDCQAYAPRDRAEARKLAGVSEDAFVVGMVAANKGRPSRKGFQQAFQAFRLLREQHDDCFLYLHTVMDQRHAEGEALGELIRSLEIPLTSMRHADQYALMYDPMPAKAMSWIYSACDVLLNPSFGEGFGVPILEAQACGVPAIVTNFSAMPEVCGAGWHVACRPFWTYQRSWQVEPDVEDIFNALKECYGMPEAKRKALSEQARAHALKYEVGYVYEQYMKPAIKQATARFEDRKPVELAVAA